MGDITEQSEKLLARQSEVAMCMPEQFVDEICVPITETGKQRHWILERDHDLNKATQLDPTNESSDQNTQLTHILSPRAVSRAIVALVMNHGPDYVESMVGTPPESVTSYTELPDTLFTQMLQAIRMSDDEKMDEWNSLSPMPTEDGITERAIAHYYNLARLIVTDPRNIIVTTRAFNDTYTPLREKARQVYPNDEGGSFIEMRRIHEWLALQGHVNLLVHPAAEELQEIAIQRTHAKGLDTYPCTLRHRPTGQFPYVQAFHFALERNSNDYVDYQTALRQNFDNLRGVQRQESEP